MPGGGDLYIVDGNHRAAIALALGRPLDAYLVPFELIFFRYLAPSEYYGSGHGGRPYQTIYYREQPVILGRRTDIFQRLDLIPQDVLAGASVLDVGANFGMNALAAAWRGAFSVLGLEQSGQLANTATRLAVLNELYPRVTFRRFDVDTDSLDPHARFDVCFMLSVFAHLRDPGRLHRIVENNIRKWVIFEGHPGSPYEMYRSFLESGLFERVTHIGDLHHSAADTATRRRPLWLCARPGLSSPRRDG
jgi:SAM-dependent methyltransferase